MERGEVGADPAARDDERDAPGKATANEGENGRATTSALKEHEREDGQRQDRGLNTDARRDAGEQSTGNRGPVSYYTAPLWRISPQEQRLSPNRERETRHVAHGPEARHPEQWCAREQQNGPDLHPPGIGGGVRRQP